MGSDAAMKAALRVVAISQAFREFWNDLAAHLDVALDIVDAAEVAPPRLGTVAVIVAAGGAERDAIRWLANPAIPTGLPVLVVGTDLGRRTAFQLAASGASDYFALPDDLETFRNAVAALLSGARARLAASVNEGDAFAGIIGESPAIRKTLARAARLAPHRNASALIVGETGTGKEILARALHAAGPRRDAPFVAINCSALPEHLIESELFGHERGAFTDAHAAKAGLFEVADAGTLFLDEVGDLPFGLQAKLLRVLEDKKIRRVGGTKERPVDVRILAATNQHLPQRVREGKFREDLLFRLSTVVLTLPALRERGDDLILIADALLKQLAGAHGVPVPALTVDVRRRLRAHAWPGNVRELKNALERVLLLSPAGKLDVDELLSSAESHRPGEIPFPAPLFQITTAAVRATVALYGGNRSESARRLRISPRRLRRLLDGDAEVGTGLDRDPWRGPAAVST